MHSPVLVTAPTMTPVSLAEAKVHLRVAEYDAIGDMIAGDDDVLIAAYIDAAVSYFDGWTGILGRCLVEQTWRQDFDCFSGHLRLPLAPLISITSVTWRDTAGQISTVATDDYALLSDALGPYIKFKSGFSWPGDLNQTKPVSVTFLAGYPTTPAIEADPEADPPVVAAPAVSTVPPAIKVAILLLVGDWYNNREASMPGGAAELPFAVNALISPFRRISI